MPTLDTYLEDVEGYAQLSPQERQMLNDSASPAGSASGESRGAPGVRHTRAFLLVKSPTEKPSLLKELSSISDLALADQLLTAAGQGKEPEEDLQGVDLRGVEPLPAEPLADPEYEIREQPANESEDGSFAVSQGSGSTNGQPAMPSRAAPVMAPSVHSLDSLDQLEPTTPEVAVENAALMPPPPVPGSKPRGESTGRPAKRRLSFDQVTTRQTRSKFRRSNEPHVSLTYSGAQPIPAPVRTRSGAAPGGNPGSSDDDDDDELNHGNDAPNGHGGPPAPGNDDNDQPDPAENGGPNDNGAGDENGGEGGAADGPGDGEAPPPPDNDPDNNDGPAENEGYQPGAVPQMAPYRGAPVPRRHPPVSRRPANQRVGLHNINYNTVRSYSNPNNDNSRGTWSITESVLSRLPFLDLVRSVISYFTLLI